jgi:hypothetical protein
VGLHFEEMATAQAQLLFQQFCVCSVEIKNNIAEATFQLERFFPHLAKNAAVPTHVALFAFPELKPSLHDLTIFQKYELSFQRFHCAPRAACFARNFHAFR